VSDTFTPREAVADALRYWEPRRIVYNTALAAVVIGHFATAWPASSATVTVDLLLLLFFLAVLANVCYCAAYAVDLFVQLSGLQEFRAKGRVAVLIVGTAFGAVIAHFFATNMFGSWR
jgi:hypothetical protein